VLKIYKENIKLELINSNIRISTNDLLMVFNKLLQEFENSLNLLKIKK